MDDLNNAPAGTDNRRTVLEDHGYAITAADFGFQDEDGDSLLAVTIVTLPVAGTLGWDADGAGGNAPVAVAAGQAISAADLAAGRLVFTPAANASGAEYASLAFRVQDDGGTADGGIDTDASANILTFDVTDVHDPPVLFPNVLGLADLGTHGFKIQGENPSDTAGTSVSGAGDVNGDGFDDIVVGAHGNDSGGSNAGAAYVIFGKASGFGPVDLAGFAAVDGFKIEGDAENDGSGLSVSSAGDVNGDGYADVLVGAYGNDSGGPGAGAAYVIFGKTSGFAAIDLTGLAATDGFKIQGDGGTAFDLAGWSVASAGDVNDDGYADVLIGAWQNDSGGSNAGAAYVVFGKASGFGLIDLGALASGDGFKIQGDGGSDFAGRSVASAGDVNGDGYADIVIGADGNASGGFDAGAAYVVFGKASGFATIDLGTPLAAADGFKLQGDDANDLAGSAVSSAGDVNGDGYADILVGAHGSDSYAGAAYVVFGKASGFATIDLGTPLAAADGFKIQGGAPGDHAGFSVSGAGDVNGDGYADIVVGAEFNSSASAAAGAAYVIFGKASGFGPIDLGDALDSADGFRIDGEGPNNRAGSSVSAAGDINNDGYDDIIVGALVNGSGGTNAGAAYVIFGRANFHRPPEGIDTIVTIGEDHAYALTAADFAFADLDDDALLAVTIVTLPGAGRLLHDADGGGPGLPAAVVAGQSIGAADIAAGRLVFVPEVDANGAGYASLTFRVQDDGDGADTDASANTLTFDVTAVNDAPTAAIATTPEKAGGEFRVNTAMWYNQEDARIAPLAGGGFVVIWHDQGSSNGRVKAQVHAADGTRVGEEITVNAGTSGQYHSGVIALASGGFAVTWTSGDVGGESTGADTSVSAIKVQLFNAAGVPVGGEILANSATAGAQYYAKTAALADGGFVVTWEDYSLGVGGAGGDAHGYAVKAQMFAADGTRVGGEMLVNTAVAGDQHGSMITALPTGGFVIAWRDYSEGVGGAAGDTDGVAIKAQVFGAGGVRTGGEIRVNTAVAGDQFWPELTALANGGFVVAWEDPSLGVGGAGGDTSGTAVKAQLFAANGDAIGGEIRVNTATQGDQSGAKVAALAGGGFVITWHEGSMGVGGATGDTSGHAVKAQLFDANGDPIGGEILVNTATDNGQTGPEIVALTDGGFVIAWNDTSLGQGGAMADASASAVKAQAFAADGTRIGSEFLVNTATYDGQLYPRLAALADGGFAVAWTDSSRSDGDNWGSAIKAQLFRPGELHATEQRPLDLKGSLFLSDVDAGSGQVAVTLSVDHGVLTVAAGSSGAAVAGSGTGSVTLTGTLAQLRALLATDAASTVTYLAPTDTPPAGAMLTLAIDDGAVAASASLRIAIAAVNDRPELSGVATAIAYAENGTAAPQLIAPSAELADRDANLGGGAVTVTYLLAEDRIAVRHQGTGAGEIGVSGASVTYGGTVIGSVTGGVGTDFTVTLTAAATIEAVEALVRNLTYANASDTPTAAHRLVLNVTDGAGGDLGPAAGWTPFFYQHSDDPNPVAGMGAVNFSSAFADIDGDGDLDAVLGSGDGTVDTYRREADGRFFHLTFANDPLHFVQTQGFAHPAFADLDGDGDMDLVVGDVRGMIYAFENDGTGGFTPFPYPDNPLAGIEMSEYATPAFGDFDDDGDVDLVIGERFGLLRTFANQGDGTLVELVGAGNPFGAIYVNHHPVPVLLDFDADGDTDLALGVYSHAVHGFRNNGDGTYTQVDGSLIDNVSRASFADLDGDGDLDAAFERGQGLGWGQNAVPHGLVLDISVQPIDDLPTAVADAVTVAENATVAIAATANDVDPEGDPVAVVSIAGAAAAVGTPVTLASGARVTLNLDGTLTYNPNGKFAYLVPAALGTGAVNTSAIESFEYAVTGGATATVTVTVTGVTSIGDQYRGDAGNNTITGTAGANLFILAQGGSDTVSGGGGEDGFYMGAALDAGDGIDGGTFANTFDQLGIQGNYAYTFSATNLVGIEILVLLSGLETSYGDPGGHLYTYELTTIDANVAAGQTLTVNGNQLYYGEHLFFDGSAETDGRFVFQTSGGDDVLIGGAGADQFNALWGRDTMTGGAGNDVFYFRYVTESPASAMDAITDFTAGDRINLAVLDANSGVAGDQAFAFIGASAFSGVAGQLRVSGSGADWVVEVDVNGDGVADFGIAVTTVASGYGWSAADFVL